MRKEIAAAFAAGLVLALGGVFTATSAMADPPKEMDRQTVVSLTIKDRADSGKGTPTDWADDTFARKVTLSTRGIYQNQSEEIALRAAEAARTRTLCDLVKQENLVWQYTAVVEDSGTFTTRHRSATGSPGEGGILVKGATGTFVGGARASIFAPAHWCSLVNRYNGATIEGSQSGSTSEFLPKLFSKDGAKAEATLTSWGWTYERCVGTDGHEKWVNADKGNDGDIHGAACPTPSPSPSESESPSESPSPSPSTSSPTATPTATATATPTETATATATPTTSLSPVDNSGALPVTGEGGGPYKLIAVGAFGVILISVGALILLGARRRRIEG